MHPDPNFHWHDEPAMRDFVHRAGFGQLIVATPDGLRVAHLPLVFAGDAAIRFHIARSNAVTPHLDGAAVLFIVDGPHAYISPDWYDMTDQVPTWNYTTVELDGVATALDRDALIAQSDALSAANEAHLLPKPPWTRAKMDPRRFDAMMNAIQAFEMRITAYRGTRKLGQNKPETARLLVADHLSAQGHDAVATAMRATLDGTAS